MLITVSYNNTIITKIYQDNTNMNKLQLMEDRRIKKYSENTYKLPALNKFKSPSASIQSQKKLKLYNSSLVLVKPAIEFKLAPSSVSKNRIKMGNQNVRFKWNKGHELERRKLPIQRFKTDSVLSPQTKHRSFVERLPSSGELGETLKSFRKYVDIHRQKIHSQINKNMNKDRSKNTKHFKNEFQTQNAPRGQTASEQRLISEEYGIFQKIKKIISAKSPNSAGQGIRAELKQAQEPVKMGRVMKKINCSDRSISLKNKSSLIDDEMGSCKWRRVNISAQRERISYEQSNYEAQNQRLTEFISKNEVCLLNYLECRKQLLDMQPNRPNRPNMQPNMQPNMRPNKKIKTSIN